MASDTIKVRLILDDGALDKTSKKAKSVGVNIGKSISSGITGALAGVATLAAAALALRSVARDFIEFERALAGVAKTTNIAGPELAILGDRLQQLSTEIPVTANELLRLSQVAGQFGVRGTENILKFAETVGKLQFAIEGIDPEQAAQNLTRMLNVTGQGIKNIDKLSSALVALGNNFEATEGEILTTGNEVIRATAVFGVSAQEALGLGAALKAVGARAEGSGTAVGKAFRKIAEAISENGTKLKRFADVIGVSGDELKKQFGDNALSVFEKFVKGLGRVSGGATGLTAKLKELGLNQDRTLKTLLPLVLANEKMTKALELSRKAFEENVALNREFDRVNQTTEAAVLRLKNEVIRLSTTLGTSLGPIIRDNIQFLTDLTSGFNTFFQSIAGTDAQKLNAEIERVNDNLRALESQQLDLIAGGKGLDGFFLDTEQAAKDLQPRIDELKQKFKELNLERQKLLAGDIDGAAAAASSDAFVEQLAAQEAALKTANENRIAGTGMLRDALALDLQIMSDVTTGLFDIFSTKLFEMKELTEEQVTAINKAIRQKLVGGIVSGVQQFTKALATGANAFKALGKSILGLLGGLATQIGTFLIATGIAQLQVLSAPGGPVIAAGIGLVALGTLLSSIGGSGFAGGAGAGGATAGGGASLADSGIDSFEQEKLAEPQTIVNVSIDGVVTDSKNVAQQIQELLSDLSDSDGGFVVNEV